LTIVRLVIQQKFRPPLPHDIPPYLKELIERMWGADPSGRPDFSEVLSVLRRGGGTSSNEGVFTVAAARAKTLSWHHVDTQQPSESFEGTNNSIEFVVRSQSEK
jgi:hypothetical protein